MNEKKQTNKTKLRGGNIHMAHSFDQIFYLRYTSHQLQHNVMLYSPLIKQLKICIFFFNVENRWKGGLRSAEAACVWLRPRCSITPHSEVELLSSGRVLCVCESAPGQHHTDTLINHWSLVCFWCWILQGGAMIAAPLGPSEIWHWKSLVLFACKVISVSVADGWLGPVRVCVCACNVCVTRSLFFFLRGCKCICQRGEREGKAEEKEWGEKELRRVWVVHEVFPEWKKKQHYTNKAAGDEIRNGVLVPSAKVSASSSRTSPQEMQFQLWW